MTGSGTPRCNMPAAAILLCTSLWQCSAIKTGSKRRRPGHPGAARPLGRVCSAAALRFLIPTSSATERKPQGFPLHLKQGANADDRGTPSQRARWAAARLLVVAGEQQTRGEDLGKAEIALRSADAQATKAWGEDDWLAFNVRAKLAGFLRCAQHSMGLLGGTCLFIRVCVQLC